MLLGGGDPPTHLEAGLGPIGAPGTPLSPSSSGIREEVAVTDRARSRRASAPGLARAFLLVAAVVPHLPGSAAAQVLRGRVVEAVTETAIPGATLTLIDSEGNTVSSVIAGTEGVFILRAPPAAGYTVTVDHIGYTRFTHGPVQLDDEGVTDLVMRLTVEVIPLNPLNVEVEARVRKLERVGFYDRKRLGQGTFIEYAQIGPHARTAADVLRRVPGLRLVIQGYFTDVQARGAGSCRPGMYIDGAFVSGPRRSVSSFNLEDLPAGDIEAIEVYPGAASVPPQYTGGNSPCGLILFWTAKPGR
jgi:hypothetical protein